MSKIQDNKHATKLHIQPSAWYLLEIPLYVCVCLPPGLCAYPPIRPSIFMLHGIQQHPPVIHLIKTCSKRAKAHCIKYVKKNRKKCNEHTNRLFLSHAVCCPFKNVTPLRIICITSLL